MKRIMAAVLVLGLTCSIANAQTTWNGGTGDWNTGSNWSTNAVPTAADNVTIGSATQFNGDPQIDAGGADGATNDLTITNNNGFTVGNGRNLRVEGNFSAGNSLSIAGGGTLEVVGSATLRSGNITAGGNISFQGNVALEGNSSLITARNVVSDSDTSWTGQGDLFITNGASWTNTSGDFRRTANPPGNLNFDGNASFVNDGTFSKDGANALRVAAGVPQNTTNGTFINNGTISVEAGTMNVHNRMGVFGNVNFVNNGNILVADGATFNLENGGALTFNGGELSGGGTISDAVDMGVGSRITPGDTMNSIRALGVDGALTLNNTTLTVEIGGTVRGTEYDFLDVSGTTDISAGPSNVVVEFVNGFAATAGETFTVLATAGFTGDTSTNLIFDFSALGGSFDVAFTDGGAGSGITFSNFTAVPEPTSLALLSLGGLGLSFVRRRRV